VSATKRDVRKLVKTLGQKEKRDLEKGARKRRKKTKQLRLQKNSAHIRDVEFTRQRLSSKKKKKTGRKAQSRAWSAKGPTRQEGGTGCDYKTYNRVKKKKFQVRKKKVRRKKKGLRPATGRGAPSSKKKKRARVNRDNHKNTKDSTVLQKSIKRGVLLSKKESRRQSG